MQAAGAKHSGTVMQPRDGLKPVRMQRAETIRSKGRKV